MWRVLICLLLMVSPLCANEEFWAKLKQAETGKEASDLIQQYYPAGSDGEPNETFDAVLAQRSLYEVFKLPDPVVESVLRRASPSQLDAYSQAFQTGEIDEKHARNVRLLSEAKLEDAFGRFGMAEKLSEEWKNFKRMVGYIWVSSVTLGVGAGVLDFLSKENDFGWKSLTHPLSMGVLISALQMTVSVMRLMGQDPKEHQEVEKIVESVIQLKPALSAKTIDRTKLEFALTPQCKEALERLRGNP